MSKKRLFVSIAVFAAGLSLAACDSAGGAAAWLNLRGASAESGSPPDGGPLKTDTPSSRRFYLDLVAGLQAKGLHRAALAYLDEYEGRFPRDDEARLMRAKSLVRLGQLDEARQIYSALTGTGYAAQAYNGLGVVASHAGKWPQAEQEFRRASHIRPTDPDFLNNLGLALVRLGRTDEAEFVLLQALELKPDNLAARDNLALCKMMEGKLADAEAVLAVLPQEDRARAHAWLAEQMKGDGGTAVEPPETVNPKQGG